MIHIPLHDLDSMYLGRDYSMARVLVNDMG